MISSLSLMVIDKARQEALADALKANNQKSAFMAFLCHELRNPLHAILNINVFLKETPLSPDQRQLLQAMSIASTYMSQIINDVLDTSKFEAGNVTFAREPVDVGGIFRQVALQTREDLRTRHVTFGMHTGTIPRLTPPGGRIDCGLWYENIRTVTTLLGRQGTTCTICLEVTDSGPGIPPDVAAIIFKPFQMSGLETSQEYSGTVRTCHLQADCGVDGGDDCGDAEEGWRGWIEFVVKIPLLMCGDVEGSGETTGFSSTSPSPLHERSFLSTPHPDHVVVSMDEDITELVDASNTPENPPHLEREVVVIAPPGNIRFSPDVSPWEPTPQNPQPTQTDESNPLHEILIPSSPHPPTSLPISPPSPSDNRAILIVDDSSINRKILVRLLRRAGVTRLIDECVNGLEAVKGRWMPIVAVTASCVGGMLKMEFGFTALAPKPFLKADAERILREFEMGDWRLIVIYCWFLSSGFDLHPLYFLYV
ncbi:hypothetical protein BC829DRAFT_419712 [Chytridium lagenaria]|nr:hypothetical protein BC829DRAFT_422386 [Chytridium lagenaria]KAI8844917.1 hypothetical protein BC829DRAFT_419712 [Chytridium lagenaria]